MIAGQNSKLLSNLVAEQDPDLGKLIESEKSRQILEGASSDISQMAFLVEGGLSLGKAILNSSKGVTIRSSLHGQDVRKATLVRKVLPKEKIDDLVVEAKLLTRAENVEVALIQLKDGTRQLVKGGRHGIKLPANTAKIYGHTHPPVRPGELNTPSTGDRDALKIFDQSKTYIFHDGQRTTIYKGKDSSFDTSTTNY